MAVNKENNNSDPNFTAAMLQLMLARFYLGPVLSDLSANAAALADAVDPDSEAAPMAEALFRSIIDLRLSEEELAAGATLAASLNAQFPLSVG